MQKILKSFIVVFFMVTVCSSVLAQPIWLGKNQGSFLGFEALKPTFDDALLNNDDLTFATSAIFISGRFFIGDAIALSGELPLAHAGVDNGDSETMVGNPYVGLELRRSDGSFVIELGARLPLAADDKFAAAAIGVFGDFDRLEAFFPEVTSLMGKINFQTVNSSNVIFRLRGGPTFLTNSDAGFLEDDNTEILIDYSGQVGLQGTITVMAGITGRYIASGEGDFGENSIHQLGASASLDLGNLIPGIELRVPIDDELNDLLDYAIGLTLGIEIQ